MELKIEDVTALQSPGIVFSFSNRWLVDEDSENQADKQEGIEGNAVILY